MKVGIIILTVFLLKVTNAKPRDAATIKAPDGHTYTVQIGRNGEETISKDGRGKEVIIPMHEQGKWVMLTENDEDSCYVLEMTDEEKSDKATELDFNAVDYDIVQEDKEADPAIKKTCEEHGGPGRYIIQMAPKSEADSAPASLQEGHEGGIVKRGTGRCLRLSIVCYRFIYRGWLYKYCRFYVRRVPC